MGDGSDGAQASVSTGSLRFAGSWNDGALGAASSAGAEWTCGTRGLFSVPLPECYACLATSAAGPSHAGLYRGERGHSEGASGRALGAAQWTGIPVPRQPLGCNRSQWRGNALRMGYVVVRAFIPAPGASHQLPLRPRARVRSLYRLQDPLAERRRSPSCAGSSSSTPTRTTDGPTTPITATPRIGTGIPSLVVARLERREDTCSTWPA